MPLAHRVYVPLALLSFCGTAFYVDFARAEASGKPFNPDISVNFLGLTQTGNRLSADRVADSQKGARLQEAELQVFSDVDPYFTANALFSIAPAQTGDYGIDPEEVFVETTFIPSLIIRGGKFKEQFGKHNTLHTHAFPFIDAPLVNQILFGYEGLNDAGVSAAWMSPLPWYSSVTVQAFNNGNTNFFGNTTAGAYAELLDWRNLWDLSEDTTLEWAVYGLQGPNQFEKNSNGLGSDLIIKWRPSIGGKYHALWWANQYLDGNRNGFDNDPATYGSSRLGGFASWFQFQFAERWWIQGRYEFVGLPHSDDFAPENKQSVLLGFFPSEFSGFRLQLDHLAQADQPAAYAVAFQYNITIGAHPAHSY